MSIVKVIFENNDFIACDKPAGVLSVPDRHKSDRLCLGLELQKQKRIQIFPVHRLDLEVSGLILYAKNSRAHKASQDWFAKKLLQKKYKALTLKQDFSHWPEKVKTEREQLDLNAGAEFQWQMKILRGKRRSFESPHGDLSETRAIYVGESREFQEWDMYPITGRSHQLRLELSRHGFPIAGDELYGSKLVLNQSQWPFGPLALRAIEITFDKQVCAEFDFPFVLSATYL
ncbi:MAG: RNA pseudouridine synthase [Bdellovibrionota bacterium]